MLSEAQLRRNMLFHVLDGVFFFAAVQMLSPEVVIPAMIDDLTHSPLLIGLVPLVTWVGMVLPQTLHARHADRSGYLKPIVLLMCTLQRVGWVAFWCSLFAVWAPGTTLGLFYAAVVVGSIGSGMASPAWMGWYAKTTPERAWAWVLGMRRAVSGVLGVGLGYLIGWTMTRYDPPGRYQVLVGGCVLFYALSFVSLLFIQEQHTEGVPEQSGWTWREYYASLMRIFSQRKDFRRFMLGTMLVSTPQLITMTYLTKYSRDASGASDAVLGTFSALFVFSMALGSVLGGRLSDRLSRVAPLMVSPLLSVASAVPACLSARPASVGAAFCLLGLGMGMQIAAVLPAIWAYAGPQRRATYGAVFFTVAGAANATLPFAAGALLDAGLLGYSVLFGACGFMALAGWLVLLPLRKPEPHGSVDADTP